METIIIPLNGQEKAEIESGDFFHSIPWDALMPEIIRLCNMRPWDKADGLIVSADDIPVKISQKVGRKPNAAGKIATEG